MTDLEKLALREELTREDWDTLRMVFAAGYAAALEHMQPSGPIGFSGAMTEAWAQYRAEDAAIAAQAKGQDNG